MSIMEKYLPDFTKLTWQLNVALMGAVFSIFSLINNTYYIYYGFVTFLFGVFGHFLDLLFSILLVNKPWRLPTFFVVQTILLIAWVVALVLIY
jgi:hypothetical protein